MPICVVEDNPNDNYQSNWGLILLAALHPEPPPQCLQIELLAHCQGQFAPYQHIIPWVHYHEVVVLLHSLGETSTAAIQFTLHQ